MSWSDRGVQLATVERMDVADMRHSLGEMLILMGDQPAALRSVGRERGLTRISATVTLRNWRNVIAPTGELNRSRDLKKQRPRKLDASEAAIGGSSPPDFNGEGLMAAKNGQERIARFSQRFCFV
jgi:hypothetical protein